MDTAKDTTSPRRERWRENTRILGPPLEDRLKDVRQDWMRYEHTEQESRKTCGSLLASMNLLL